MVRYSLLMSRVNPDTWFETQKLGNSIVPGGFVDSHGQDFVSMGTPWHNTKAAQNCDVLEVNLQHAEADALRQDGSAMHHPLLCAGHSQHLPLPLGHPV